MGQLRIAPALLFLIWLGISPTHADIDTSEYEPKTSIRSEKQRQQMKALLEAEKKAENEQRQKEEAAEAMRLAEEKAAWDALPYGVKLIALRCTACHVDEVFKNQRHNRLGWELVVLRMQYLNKLELGEGERSVIAAHLAQNYPATGTAAAVETILQILAILSLPVLWLTWRRVRSMHLRIRA